jgi:hypothetical protein
LLTNEFYSSREEEKGGNHVNDDIIPKDFSVGENTPHSFSDSDSDDSESSIESHLSRASNWTKGRSRQRLKVPVSLKNNNFISKAVKERKSTPKA